MDFSYFIRNIATKIYFPKQSHILSMINGEMNYNSPGFYLLCFDNPLEYSKPQVIKTPIKTFGCNIHNQIMIAKPTITHLRLFQ